MANSTTTPGQGDPSFDLIQYEIFTNKANHSLLQSVIAPPFVNSPQLRGTLTILWSCIFTLTACIYTALHLNVPGERSKFQSLVSKGKWVLIGLLAPEVVLYLACSQYLEAGHLVRELNRMLRDQKGEDDLGHPKFDLKYGFFVVMGGLEVAVSDFVERGHGPRGTLSSGFLRLTKDGVLQLATLGRFIHVPRSKIDDKSKADVLQKCVVITQVCWMAMQCVARKSYGLPLSLIEVHTLVHVGCALIMYFFWMKKPLDMHSPEIVDLSDFDDVLALMIQEQFGYALNDDIVLYPRQSTNSNPASIKWISPDGRDSLPETDINGRVYGVQWVVPDHSQPTSETLTVGRVLDCGVGVVARLSTFEPKRQIFRAVRQGYEYLPMDDDDRYEDVVRIFEPTLPIHSLLTHEVTRLTKVVSAIERIEGKVVDAQPFHPQSKEPRYPSEHYHRGFNLSAGNFSYTGTSEMDPDDIVTFIIQKKVLLVLLLVLPALYGGIHLAVGNASHPYFPSTIERQLWDISCVDITATMPTFILLTLFGRFMSLFMTQDDGDDCVGSVFYKLPGHLLLLCYISCRFFIVVESFISLRHVPIGVFWMPSWLQMIPHI